ncbi:hypothetical protein, partial [Escherichia coli]|uniref:hypothetical protein n=1 Tax=Escherichia coli TaxID=562 RepID=UPI002540D733
SVRRTTRRRRFQRPNAAKNNMVANKMFLAVAAVAAVALVQVNARPADTDWAIPFENALKNITSSFTAAIEHPADFANLAKNSLNTFSESMKNDLTNLYKTFDSKTGVSDMVKDATKQWQTTVDTYSKNLPEEFTNVQKFNEKFESTLKGIIQNATDLSKKAQGNTEVEKQIS